MRKLTFPVGDQRRQGSRKSRHNLRSIKITSAEATCGNTVHVYDTTVQRLRSSKLKNATFSPGEPFLSNDSVDSRGFFTYQSTSYPPLFHSEILLNTSVVQMLYPLSTRPITIRAMYMYKLVGRTAWV
jgi:hypothetical protein